MTFEDILYSKANGVARITINREKVMNAFRAQTVEEMRGALRATIKGLEPYINPLTVKARLHPRQTS